MFHLGVEVRTGMQSRKIEEKAEEKILEDLIAVSEIESEKYVAGQSSKIFKVLIHAIKQTGPPATEIQ